MNFESIKDMEKENKDLNEKSTPLKVAELATFLYAILVFMSLLVDSAYYRQFNISIVSYMSASEILLSCIEQIPNYLRPLINTLKWFVFSYVLTTILMTLSRPKGQSIFDYLFSIYLPDEEDIVGKLRIIFTYSVISIYLPLSCFVVCDPSIWSIPMTKEDFWMIFFIPIFIEVVLITTVVILWRLLRGKSSHPLSPTSIKVIEKVYSLRFYFIIILFCFGLFTSQLLTETKRAVLVKDVGTEKNILIEGENIHVDTRVEDIIYVGESSGFIFLYDKTNQATIVYDRKRITNYRMFSGAFVSLSPTDRRTHRP